MVKVKNVEVTEINLRKSALDKKNKDMQLCLQYLTDHSQYNTIEKQLELLPEKSEFIVRFELHNATSALSNAIRRGLVGETPVLSLNPPMDPKYLEKNDDYVLVDQLVNTLARVPINQQIPDWENVVLSLHKHNKTRDSGFITTSDLVWPEHNIEDIIMPNIELCILRPDMFVKLENITISRDIGNLDAGRYGLVGNTYYDILDVVPMDEETDVVVGSSGGHKSILANMPTVFKLGYTTHRNVDDIMYPIHACCDSLIDRLNRVLVGFYEIQQMEKKGPVSQYFTETLDMESEFNGAQKVFYIKGEQWTMANLLYAYCFMEKSLSFATPAIEHPDKEIAIFKIVDDNYINVIVNATEKMIADLWTVRAAFKSSSK